MSKPKLSSLEKDLALAKTEITAADFREKGSGRYAHRSMDTLCVCGHTLGMHTAASSRSARPCIIGDFEDFSCNCEKFRKARR